MKKDQTNLLIACGVGAALLWALKSKNDEKASAGAPTEEQKKAVQAKRRSF